MKYLAVAALAVICLSLPGARARAQSTTTVEFDVMDQDNNPIADATVELEYKGHVAQKYKGKTNKKGRFTYVRVYVGPYTVRIVKEGFGEAKVETFPIRDKGQFEKPTRLQLKRKTGLPAAAGQPLEGTDGTRVSLLQAVNAAVQLVHEGKYDEAEAAYLKLLELVPNSADVHYNLGFLYKRKAQLDQAEAQFRKAIECDPKQAEAYNALSVLLVEKRKSDEALQILETGLAAGVADPRLQLSLGFLYMNTGRAAVARSAFERAVELDPSAAEPHFHLGSLALSRNDRSEGIVQLEKYLALAPADAPNVETAKQLLAALQPAPKK